MIGKTLGHYEIAFPSIRIRTGAVCQAQGQKLGSDAAAKVPPKELHGMLIRTGENGYRCEPARRRRDALTMSEE